MILFLKKVFLLRSVNKANRLHLPCVYKAMPGNETGNKMETPDKKGKVVHVVHIPGSLFTIKPGSLGTFCATDNFRHRGDDKFDFCFPGIAPKGKTNEGICQFVIHA